MSGISNMNDIYIYEINSYKIEKIVKTPSRSFSSDSSGELDVLGHDGHSLGVDGAEVGVLEEANQVGFGCFLESEDGGGLESEVVLELSSNLSDESLEGELSDEELSALLEFSDFSESNSSWSESVGLLDSSLSGGGSLLGLLVSDVLSWGLATSVLSSSLLGSCHFIVIFRIIPSKIQF